jgi:hypothetical protein
MMAYCTAKEIPRMVVVQFETAKGFVIPKRGLSARGICCCTGWQQADSSSINLASE